MRLSKLKENIFFKITGIFLICAFVFSFVLPKEAFATRSNAGGGDTTTWSWEDFALTVCFSLAGTVIGGAISSYLGGSGGSTFYTELAKNIDYNHLANGYTTYVASSQVGGAVNAAGNYYNWDRNATYIASLAAAAATAGALNPTQALGKGTESATSDIVNMFEPIGYSSTVAAETATASSQAFNMLKGAGVGAIGGAAGAAVHTLIDPDALKEGRSFSALAQIAGLFAETYATSLARATFDSATYKDKTYAQIAEKIFVEAPLTSKGGMIRQWPIHATSALQILAVQSLGENNAHLAMLVRGVIGAVAQPVFTKLELIFKPGEKLSLIITTKSQLEYKSSIGPWPDKQKTAELTLAQQIGSQLIQALVSGGLYAVIDHNIDLKTNPAGYTLASMLVNTGATVARGVAARAQAEEFRAKGKLKSEEDVNKFVTDSIAKSTSDYINRAFSFGLPDGVSGPAGEVVSSDNWVIYMNRLRYLSNLTSNYGFTAALAYQAGGAYIGATTDSLMYSMNQIPQVASLLGTKKEPYSPEEALRQAPSLPLEELKQLAPK